MYSTQFSIVRPSLAQAVISLAECEAKVPIVLQHISCTNSTLWCCVPQLSGPVFCGYQRRSPHTRSSTPVPNIASEDTCEAVVACNVLLT